MPALTKARRIPACVSSFRAVISSHEYFKVGGLFPQRFHPTPGILLVFVRRGTSRERIKAGRHALLAMSYDDFEKKIVDQLQAIWGP